MARGQGQRTCAPCVALRPGRSQRRPRGRHDGGAREFDRHGVQWAESENDHLPKRVHVAGLVGVAVESVHQLELAEVSDVRGRWPGSHPRCDRPRDVAGSPGCLERTVGRLAGPPPRARRGRQRPPVVVPVLVACLRVREEHHHGRFAGRRDANLPLPAEAFVGFTSCQAIPRESTLVASGCDVRWRYRIHVV